MVNFGLNSASILGIFLAVAGAGLYFLRSVRPELARDHDIFFAAVGLLCGFILLFQGWRLDPILQFGQLLLTGSAIFFAVESIRLRGVATEQARRNTPIVDRDRPVSRTRVYTEAELDKIDPYDRYEGTPNYDSPRLRGYDDPQPRTRSSRSADIDEPPRSRNTRSRSERPERPSSNSPRDSAPPTRRRPSAPPQPDTYDDFASDRWDEPGYSEPSSRNNPQDDRYSNYSEPPSRPSAKRRDEPADWGRSYEDDLGQPYEDDDVVVTDYVDYQPFDEDRDDYSDYPDTPKNEPKKPNRPSNRERRPNIEVEPERNNPIDFDY
jgi:hypothetical protein